MMHVTDREVLQELAERHIGSPELQRECEAKAHAIAVGAEKPSPEMTEAWERANKKWLPAGKRSANGKDERERRQAFSERQGRTRAPASVQRTADRSRGRDRGRWRHAGRPGSMIRTIRHWLACRRLQRIVNATRSSFECQDYALKGRGRG